MKQMKFKIRNFLKRVERVLLTDKLSFSWKFRKKFGRWVDWKNPKTFNEKIIWRNLYDRKLIYSELSDKFLVREYIKKRGCSKYLVPLLFFGSPKELKLKKNWLPFVIKTNNTMGDHKFVRNKREYLALDINELKTYYSNMLSQNYYSCSREWQYKNIKPLLLVEKFLKEKGVNKNFAPATDYKIHCFKGKAEFVNVDFDKSEEKGHGFKFKRCCFDRRGNGLPFEYGYNTKLFKNIYNLGKINKENFIEMISLAEKLSKGFDYVRVDLYFINDRIYFGELTFTTTGGFGKFKPEKWDKYYGSLWKNKKFKDHLK